MNRQRYFRTKPANVVLYETLQLYHPDLGWFRYVTGQQEPKAFGVDGIDEVFEPFGFVAGEPEQGEEGEVVMNIQLGAVGAFITEKVKRISNWRAPLTVKWAQYLSTDHSTPVISIDMEAHTLTLEDRVAAIRAGQVNFAAYDVAVTYKTDVFPGLAVAI